MPDVEVDLSDLCQKCLRDGRCDEHTADAQRKAQRTAASRRKKAAKLAQSEGNGKHAPATSRRSPKARANGHK